MAENSTVYKATIQTQVEGTESVNKLTESVDEAGFAFEQLKEEISKTQKELQAAVATGDKVKFTKLKAELNDLQDNLDKSGQKGAAFGDSMASLPGPAGDAGNAIKGMGDAFKAMLANPVVLVIAAIVGVFLLMKKSMESTAEGQDTLNKAGEAFQKILGPILALIERIALPIFKIWVDILFEVAAAFEKVALWMGISQEKIDEASSGNEDFAATAKEAAEAAAALAEKNAEAARKLAEDAKRTAEEARKRAEEEKLRRIEAAKLAIGFAAKEKTAEENLANARKSIYDDRLEQIRNLQTESDTAYQNEVNRINSLLEIEGLAENEKRQLLIDRTNAEAKYVSDKRARDQQLADEETKRKEDAAKKAEEDNARLAEIDSQNRAERANRIMAEYDLQQRISAQSFQSQLDVFNQVRELERMDLAAKMASADAMAAFDAQTASVRIDIERSATEAKLGIISNALATVASAVGEQTAAGKAMAIASAVIDTYVGANKAMSTYPPPFGQIAAGTVILAGLMNVKKIIQTKLPDVPGATASTPNIAAPSISVPTAPQLQGGVGVNPSTQIAETLATATNKPIKAFVVSTDMSSQQAADRRVTSASTF